MSSQAGEDLLDWLDTAITLLERAARKASEAVGGSSWDGWDREVAVALPSGDTIADGVMYGDMYEPMAKEACEHIAMHDPESVLRRCAADRKLIALHSDNGGVCAVCAGEEMPSEDSEGGVEWTRCEAAFPCSTIRALAEGHGWTTKTSAPAPAQTPPTDGDPVT